MHPTETSRKQGMSSSLEHNTTLYASLELSRSTWLLTSLSPGSSKMSKRVVAGGNGNSLLAIIDELRIKAERYVGGPVNVLVVQEAGLDGFWVHRLLA